MKTLALLLLVACGSSVTVHVAPDTDVKVDAEWKDNNPIVVTITNPNVRIVPLLLPMPILYKAQAEKGTP